MSVSVSSFREQISNVNILYHFSGLFDIQHIRPVPELVEHHFLRLAMFQEITCIHDSVPVQVLSNPD